MKNTYLILADGFEEIEGITVVDAFRRSNLVITTVSIMSKLEVTGSHGITIYADVKFSDVDFSEGDMLILPGGQPGVWNLDSHDDLKKIILNYFNDGKHIAAICAAPIIFAKLNILSGKNAICFPDFREYLQECNIVQDSVVTDGNITTSLGVGTSFDFANELIRIKISRNNS